MVTQKDVAQALGLSQSFVSRALNGNLGTKTVPLETIDKVKETARKMGYHKNRSALAFLSGRHHVLGVFIQNVGIASSGITDALIHGITQEADKRRQKLWLKIHGSDTDHEKLFNGVNRGTIDGLIYTGAVREDVTRKLIRLQEYGLPVIWVSSKHADSKDDHNPPIPGIMDDDVAVGEMATRHLIEAGCRKIAHFECHQFRTKGYRKALRQAAIHYDSKLIRSVPDYHHNSGAKATRQLLDESIEFDGIVAQSDAQAVGAINVLLKAGISIPQQVKVIGVDNSPYCELAQVPLSSVFKNENKVGQKAIAMLIDLINGQKVKSTTIPPVVIERESSKPGMNHRP